VALHGANDTPSGSLDERRAFVRAHTVLARVPFVTEISLFTATDVTPLWRATQEWLGTFGLEVPFWCVPWAGGQALARWVLDHPESVRGKRVADFGAGSGLVAIACARAGASSVRAIDVDPLAEAACLLNAEANGVALEVVCADVVDTALDTDVLLAGDVWYERAPAARFGAWLTTLASSGVCVLTGDPSRAYVPAGLHELARYDVPTCADLESTTVRVTRVLELLTPAARQRGLRASSQA
jgi:predicted nicotinamide N-methyase